jgi:hypothetical protein
MNDASFAAPHASSVIFDASLAPSDASFVLFNTSSASNGISNTLLEASSAASEARFKALKTPRSTQEGYVATQLTRCSAKIS